MSEIVFLFTNLTIRLCILVGVITSISNAHLLAAAPRMTSYQGHVRVSGTNFNGIGRFKFVLVSKPTDLVLWSNDGTGFDGSEPAAAVSVGVSNGLFTVLLGDDSLPNMLPLPGDMFTANSNVGLRIWFDDGVNGSVQLTPDTRLASVPYALSANITTGSVSNDHLASGSIDPSKLNAASAPQPGSLLSYDGAGFDWMDPSEIGGVWGANGSDAYYTAGDVGIGTTTPSSKLTVRTSGIFGAYGVEHTDGTVRLSTYLDSTGAWLGTRSPHSLSFYVNDGLPSMAVETSGNIVMTPNGGMGGYGSTVFGTPNGESGLSIRGKDAGANRADLRFDGATLKMVASIGTGPPPSENGIAVRTSGRVGIGTTNPIAQLHVETTPSANIGVYARNQTGSAIYADGNAAQAREKGGFVKAMLQINDEGTIMNCFNSFNNQSAGNCGFSAARNGINITVAFPFQIGDRFISMTPVGQFKIILVGSNGLTVERGGIGSFYVFIF